MTPREWDEFIDAAVERFRRGQAESVLDAWNRTAPDVVTRDPAARRYAEEMSWLHEQCSRIPPPAPIHLAARVVATLHSPVVARSRTANRIRIVATATAALAASVLIAVVSIPRDGIRQPDVVATSQPTDVDVAEAVRQGTAAYVQLMQSLASTVTTPSSDGPRPSGDVQLANGSPVGRAIQRSTRTIRSAGEDLRAGVEPITGSALDAFGFLWKPASTHQADPST